MANLSFWSNAPDLGCSPSETAAWLAYLNGKQTGTPPYPAGYTAWASSLNGGPAYTPPVPPVPQSSGLCELINQVVVNLGICPIPGPEGAALNALLASYASPSSPLYGVLDPYVPATTWPSARDVWLWTSSLPGAPYIPVGN
jgi:hypothetical protein